MPATPSTISISLVDVIGPAANAVVRFHPVETPFIDDDVIVVGGVRNVTTDATGVGEVDLEPGTYYVTFRGVPQNHDRIKIVVPAGGVSTTLASCVVHSSDAGVRVPNPPWIVGPGIPAGGMQGQIPVKLSGDDFDLGWKTLNAATIGDSTVAGRALLTAADITAQRTLLGIIAHYPEITGLTGGGTNLDAMATVSLAVDYILSIDVEDSISFWKIKTGAASGSDVAPLDYNAETNNKKFVRIGGF